ncbi:hypothetical protein CEV32_3265 [Brucella rhizosphaerae]|uniref:Uncharacterized protein n=1 Tax=Brucella rhizosphaerae TaxID=571254 RepID=A0A256FU67_9HYPH|nr:hypothetical protein CEV32_3265 [Brucella rhizosphaerae]
MKNTVLLRQLIAKRHLNFNDAWLTARELGSDQLHSGLTAKTLLDAFLKIWLGYSVRWHKIPRAQLCFCKTLT